MPLAEADFFDVARGAAGGSEQLVTRRYDGGFLSVSRLSRGRSGQVSQIAHQRIALGLVHIEAGGLVVGLQRHARLLVARHIQAELDGAGGQCKIFERWLLGLPAEAADLAVFLLRRPAGNVRIFFVLQFRQIDDGLFRNRIDQADAEQGHRISL